MKSVTKKIFDVAPPAAVSATSRPIIGTQPVQADPMMTSKPKSIKSAPVAEAPSTLLPEIVVSEHADPKPNKHPIRLAVVSVVVVSLVIMAIVLL